MRTPFDLFALFQDLLVDALALGDVLVRVSQLVQVADALLLGQQHARACLQAAPGREREERMVGEEGAREGAKKKRKPALAQPGVPFPFAYASHFLQSISRLGHSPQTPI